MKKLLRIEDILVSFISAIGSGIGYAIPKTWGFSELICIVSCIFMGLFMEKLGNKLIKTKWAQKCPTNRDLTAILTILVFLILTYLTEKLFKHSLWDDFSSELLLGGVGASIAGFVTSSLVAALRTYLVKLRYKDGSKGHEISELELYYIERLKGQNKEIQGEYDTDLAVKTESGIYVSRHYHKVQEFLGIPYAKPPVGKLRWKAPQRVESSNRVWEAYYFGAAAIQPDNQTISLKTFNQSEDCLTLNIWRSVKKENGNKLKPVLMYVHGGNLAYGGSAEPLYNGREFVKKFPDSIVVSFNYRLGLFGFMDNSGLPENTVYEDTCNLGILDQIMALNWVHDNIRAFGGDPDNIMLAGETMGAYCIKILSILEETNKLFKKALLISCNTVITDGETKRLKLGFSELMKEYGVTTVDELLDISEEKLKQFAYEISDKYIYSPVYDGKLITKDVDQAIKDGDSGDISFIYGIPANELSTWMTIGNEEIMYQWIHDTFNDLMSLPKSIKDKFNFNELVESYRKEGLSDQSLERSTLEFWIYRYSSLMNCLNLSESGKEVRCFYWDVNSPVKKIGGNSIAVVGALLGNNMSAENLGHVIDNTVQQVFQSLIHKALTENKYELLYDEIKGLDGFEWTRFDCTKSQVLHISSNNVKVSDVILAVDINRIKKFNPYNKKEDQVS